MIYGLQDFFFLATWWVGYFFTAVQEFFFYYICAACNFFLPTSASRKFFFKITHPPPPPQELNGRPLREEYNSLYEHLSKGAIIRSRAKWYEYGEKSNKYFLNLENHRKSKSSVRKIFTKDGLLTSDPTKIMKEVEYFYSDL